MGRMSKVRQGTPATEPLVRIDIPLSNAHKLALLFLPDGEVAIRVLELPRPERWEYRTRAILVEAEEVDAMERHGHVHLDMIPLIGELHGDSARFYLLVEEAGGQDVRLVGWVERRVVRDCVRAFKRKVQRTVDSMPADIWKRESPTDESLGDS